MTSQGSMIYHTRISVANWKSERADLLDEALIANGSSPIDLPWDSFEFIENDDHFTDQGAATFADALVAAIPVDASTKVVRILADSTIGYNDFDEQGDWTNFASDRIRRLMMCRHPTLNEVIVDAVCGSGFAALSRLGLHFYSRLPRRGVDPYSVVFVGGWNDLDKSPKIFEQAVNSARRCASKL